jgi:hypothetical protein
LRPIKHFKLAEGETLSLDIEGPEWNQPPTGILSVNVLTQAGLPLPGAKAWLVGQGTTLKPTRDYDENHFFAGKPGDYTLHAIYPGYKQSQQSVTLRAIESGAPRESLPTAQVWLARE